MVSEREIERRRALNSTNEDWFALTTDASCRSQETDRKNAAPTREESLLLHTTENPGKFLVTNFLKGNNFLVRRRTMMIILVAKTKRGYANGSIVQPEKNIADYDNSKENGRMILLTIKQSMAIAIEVEFVFGFLDETGLKPETITDVYITLNKKYSMIFAWINYQKFFQPMKVETECYRNVVFQPLKVEIFYCGIKSNQNALCDNDEAVGEMQKKIHISLDNDGNDNERGHLDFVSDPWPSMPSSAKDLVKKMLQSDPKDRLTAVAVLNHPWMRDDGDASDKPLDIAVLPRMKQFRAMNKLKKVALKVIAENLSEEEIIGLKEMFKFMDTDNSGTITFKELKAGLQMLGTKLSESKVRQLMEATDSVGQINYDEFACNEISEFKPFRMFFLEGILRKGCNWETNCQVGISWHLPNESHLRRGCRNSCVCVCFGFRFDYCAWRNGEMLSRSCRLLSIKT